MLGDRLKKCRKKVGKTCENMSKILGLNITTYYNYESGKAKPDSEQIVIICSQLNCSPNYLFGLDSDEKADPNTEIALNILKQMSEPLKELSILILQGLKSQGETLRIANGNRHIESIAQRIKSGSN